VGNGIFSRGRATTRNAGAGVAGAALIKRLSASDPQCAQALLAEAGRVLSHLPGRGMSRARLAADALGDSHGLDNGRAVATIVLRACAADPSIDVVDATGLQNAEESSPSAGLGWV